MLLIKPFVWILLGLKVRDKPNLPKRGPAIIAANHNSHLDTMVLMALYPLHKLHLVVPAAAADYWYSSFILRWFSQNILRAAPVYRKLPEGVTDPLQSCYDALANNKILIFFPEGSRGEPEKLGRFKFGLAKLVEKYPHIPVVPVYLHGLGFIWPKGTRLIVPDTVNVQVGKWVYWENRTRHEFMRQFSEAIHAMANQFSRSPNERES